MKPNEFQKLAATVYGGGDYAWMASAKNWRKELSSCGDTLFAFIMIELSTKEGCETWDDARQRIDTAISDLGDIAISIRRRKNATD